MQMQLEITPVVQLAWPNWTAGKITSTGKIFHSFTVHKQHLHYNDALLFIRMLFKEKRLERDVLHVVSKKMGVSTVNLFEKINKACVCLPWHNLSLFSSALWHRVLYFSWRLALDFNNPSFLAFSKLVISWQWEHIDMIYRFVAIGQKGRYFAFMYVPFGSAAALRKILNRDAWFPCLCYVQYLLSWFWEAKLPCLIAQLSPSCASENFNFNTRTRRMKMSQQKL